MALSPLAGLVAACGGSSSHDSSSRLEQSSSSQLSGLETPSPSAPPPTSTPEPYVVPAGDNQYSLMAGTPYETALYILGSGKPGPIAMVLGGVHGNEPGGWLAAERIVDKLRPQIGALLVVPRANKVAISRGERTDDDLADLNRSYPGFVDGKPMERMAVEIVNAIRYYHVNLVQDMHESWAFYKDRTTNGTAFLGQTVATQGAEGVALVTKVVDKINTQILSDQETFFTRDFGNPTPQPNLPRQTSNVPEPGRGTSSLGLDKIVPGVIPILVEMGQQQTLERRIALHVQLFQDVLAEIGMGTV